MDDFNIEFDTEQESEPISISSSMIVGFDDFSEHAAAQEFVARNILFYRWTAGKGWVFNSGEIWVRDQCLKHEAAIQVICTEMASNLEGAQARNTRSAKFIKGVASIARAHPRIAMPDDEFDSDPDRLNTPDGVISLPHFTMKKRRPEDYFTQCTSVSPSSESPKLFLKTIGQIFKDDENVIEFIQRFFGYCATGQTDEQVIVFFHGDGSNGKSLLLDLINDLLGTYAIKLPISALMHKKYEGHPTEIAMLFGARLAVSSEPPRTAKWDEARVKEMTGDKRLTARFMRGDFFQFTASHKHLIAANYPPQLNGSDPANARRMIVVPFKATFHHENRDNSLPKKLQTEAPQILGWILEGARKWYAEGLNVPQPILEASLDYMRSMDDLGLWLEDCCDVSFDFNESAKNLFTSFCDWRKFQNEPPMSQKLFGAEMSTKGFKRRKTGGIYKYIGLKLKTLGAGTVSDISQFFKG